LLDYKPADRPKYIDAFLSNVDWSVVEHRFQAVHVTAEAR
jgi:superoxide dismutase